MHGRFNVFGILMLHLRARAEYVTVEMCLYI